MIEIETFTFDYFIDNFEVFKSQYTELLTPFFNIKEIRKLKNIIYSLDMAEYKKDIIWEILNEDIIDEELETIIKYVK